MSRWIAVLVGALIAVAAHAQPYPSKPVRVIVQFPPGGTPDIYGRVMAAELSKLWGQSVTVENRTGASGTIGTDAAVKSPADGYTLLFAADAPITIMPNLMSKLAYDPQRDLMPISIVAEGGFIVLVHPSLPATNVAALIALAKEKPGQLSFASSGAGSQQHLTFELIQARGGVKMVHIPYKGFGQAVTDVVANQVPMLVGGVTASIGLIRGGKLRSIGVTEPQRNPQLPEIPAIAETLPGFNIQAWYGFLAPAGVPAEIVKKIHADIVAIVRTPEFLERLKKDAIAPVANTPDEFAARIKRETVEWAGIVKSSGARLE